MAKNTANRRKTRVHKTSKASMCRNHSRPQHHGAALKALLDLAPLHLEKQKEARMETYRLLIGDIESGGKQSTAHPKLTLENNKTDIIKISLQAQIVSRYK